MSKGGKFNKPTWKSQYSGEFPRPFVPRYKVRHFPEHDFRGGGDTRKVIFKTNKHKKDNRDWVSAGRSYLQDEDIDMGGSSGGGRYSKKFYKRDKKRGTPPPNHKRRLMEGPMSWFRVTVSNKFAKSEVIVVVLVAVWKQVREVVRPEDAFR